MNFDQRIRVYTCTIFLGIANSSIAVEQLLQFNHDLQEITEASSNESGKLGFPDRMAKNWKGPKEALSTLKSWTNLKEPPATGYLEKAASSRFGQASRSNFKSHYAEKNISEDFEDIFTDFETNFSKYKIQYRPEVVNFLEQANALLNELWKKIENWRKEDFPSLAPYSSRASVFWEGPEKALAALQEWVREPKRKNQPLFVRLAAKSKPLDYPNIDSFNREYLEQYVGKNFAHAFEKNRENPNKYRREVVDFLRQAEELLGQLWTRVEKWREEEKKRSG